MPFKSKAQRRKFYALKSQGKMDQKTIDEWEKDTPQGIPERLQKKAFWQGFMKAADVDSGGKGFTGSGKGQLAGSLEHDYDDGIAHEPEGRDPETHTDHTLLDRERNPRDFSPFQAGPALEDENGTKIVY